MKLLNNLYVITERDTTSSSVRYNVFLQEKSFIYQAHFPHEPITPGVCIIQIAKELLEDYAQKHYTIIAVKNVKFLSVISPVTTPRVTYVMEKIISDEASKPCGLQVQVLAAEVILAKLSLTCQEI